jgi:hypothetical protein
LFFLLGDCKKYDEDKFISFRRPFKRIEKRQWNIKKISVNSEDITSSYNDSISPRLLSEVDFKFDLKVEIGAHDPYRFVYLNYSNTNPSIRNPEIAVWESYISKDKKELIFHYGETYTRIVDTLVHKKLFNLLQGFWNIKNLYGGKMHVSKTDNINTYDIYFENK